MSFHVAADAYGRFMGRYAEPLAVRFADLAEVRAGERALDVGCGPGALTAELVRRLGADAVSAVDPSEPFVAAVRDRLPTVDVRLGVAEDLPYADATFDVALAQLVVHFMTDPVAGLTEMARVTRPGGRVAACVWDHAGGTGPLALFWRAVQDVDPQARDEGGLAGAGAGRLQGLASTAGLEQVQASTLTVLVSYDSFEEWWEPFTLGVGPAGVYLARQDHSVRERVRERCLALQPPAPFTITATAWSVLAVV